MELNGGGGAVQSGLLSSFANGVANRVQFRRSDRDQDYQKQGFVCRMRDTTNWIVELLLRHEDVADGVFGVRSSDVNLIFPRYYSGTNRSHYHRPSTARPCNDRAMDR